MYTREQYLALEKKAAEYQRLLSYLSGELFSTIKHYQGICPRTMKQITDRDQYSYAHWAGADCPACGWVVPTIAAKEALEERVQRGQAQTRAACRELARARMCVLQLFMELPGE